MMMMTVLEIKMDIEESDTRAENFSKKKNVIEFMCEWVAKQITNSTLFRSTQRNLSYGSVNGVENILLKINTLIKGRVWLCSVYWNFVLSYVLQSDNLSYCQQRSQVHCLRERLMKINSISQVVGHAFLTTCLLCLDFLVYSTDISVLDNIKRAKM